MSSFIYCGSIVLSQPVGEKIKEFIAKEFTFDGVEIIKNSIEFEDYENGPIGDALNGLVEAVKEKGAEITYGTVSYCGDCDGGFIYNPEKGVFEDTDYDDYVILTARDDVILDEAIRRGLFKDAEYWKSVFGGFIRYEAEAEEPDCLQDALRGQAGLTGEDIVELGIEDLFEGEEDDEGY